MNAEGTASTAGEPDWAKAERERAKRANAPILIVLAILALLFLPMTVLASSVLGLMGFAMVRSALVHRQEGWPWGLAFGIALLLFGFAWIVVGGYRLFMQ